MSNKKNNDPIVLRTMIFGGGNSIYRGRLIALGDHARKIVIEKQSQVDKEITSTEERARNVKKLVIYPDFTDLKKAEIDKRTKAVENYLKDHTVLEALEEVGKEVVPANPENKDSKETVLTWQKQIEKDLGFEVKTRYVDAKEIEEIEIVTTETEYKYKKIHSVELLFRVRAKDFMKHVNTFLLNQKK